MIEIDISYDGNLRCTSTHGPSKIQLVTDAPRDNHGRGETFSPTDLLATALGTCMATLMGIRARPHGWDLTGLRVHVEKEMTTSPPRKVWRLTTRLSIPAITGAKLSAEARAELEDAANTCPVRLSISETIDVPVTFDWNA